MIKIIIEVRVNDQLVSCDMIVHNDLVKIRKELEFVIDSIQHNLRGKSPLEPIRANTKTDPK